MLLHDYRIMQEQAHVRMSFCQLSSMTATYKCTENDNEVTTMVHYSSHHVPAGWNKEQNSEADTGELLQTPQR